MILPDQSGDKMRDNSVAAGAANPLDGTGPSRRGSPQHAGEAAIGAIQDRYTVLRGKVSEAKAELAAQTARLDEVVSRRCREQAQLDAALAELTGLGASIAALNEEQTTLRQSVDRARTEHQRLTAMLAALMSLDFRHTQLQIDVSNCEVQLDSLRQEAATAQNLAGKASGQLAEVENRLADANLRLRERDDAEAQRDSALALFEQTQARLAGTLTEIRNQEARLEGLAQEQAELSKKVSALRRKATILESEIQGLESRKAELQADPVLQVDQLGSVLSSYQSRGKELESEVEALRRENMDLQEQIAEMQKKLDGPQPDWLRSRR
jgi:chromosome segregation ATPase